MFVGDTRDKVGEAVGMSGKTYEKAKAVVEAAEANITEPYERMGKAAKALADQEKKYQVMQVHYCDSNDPQKCPI